MKFKKGITNQQVDQLIEYTNTDPDIQKYTRDLNRFKDHEKFNTWSKLGRTIYTLVDEEDNLMGIVWIGYQPIPEDKEYILDVNHRDYGVTFAVRLYSKARGKSLSEDFIKKAINDFKPQKKIWIDTSADNIRGINLYKKLGYETATKTDHNNLIIMVES